MPDSRLLHALLVDDEPAAHAGLRALLREHADVRVIETVDGGRDAIRAIHETHPDVVFLDVQMPGIDGFGVVHAVGPALMPAVVFVTAYDEFALRAFDAHAVDYLLKPVAPDRLARALSRVRERLAQGRAADLEERLRALLAGGARGDGRSAAPRTAGAPLLVKAGVRDVVLATGEIDWIEADDDRVRVHAGPKIHVLGGTLAGMLESLDPACFLRIHRSTVISLSRIAALERHPLGAMHVVLRDGTRLPVSRRYRAPLLSRFAGAP
ncbi:MAG TPA: response regulator [Gemmatimonadales bacterium]|nr:response regulator [Gemmatimonadales bacterium]